MEKHVLNRLNRMRPSNRGMAVPVGKGDEHESAEYAFRFVEVGQPSQGGDVGDSRSVVRAHVMRDFYERRDRIRRPGTLPQVMSDASKKEGVSQQMHRFKQSPEGLRELKKGRKKSIKPQNSKGVSSQGRSTLEIQSSIRDPGHSPPQARAADSSNLEHQQHQSEIRSDEELERSVSEQSAIGSERGLSSTWAQVTPHPAHLPAGATLVDPFNALPQINSSRTQLLLYHANQGILSSRLMGQLRIEWLSLATQDAAFFYVALSHYAGNYSLANKKSDPIEALRFRTESIKLVNSRLENTKSAIEDGTLGTVASLSSYEATNGSLKAIKTHLKGLRKLIQLRGGLQDPNMSPYTRRLILWADLNCANALGTNSIFQFPNLSDMSTIDIENQSYIDSFVNQDGELGAEGLKMERLSFELKENFTNLKYLANLNSNEQECRRGTKLQQIHYSDRLYFTERSLQRLSNFWGPKKFVTSGCIAAIIFLDNYLRGIQLTARLMDTLVARLQYSMRFVLEEISQHEGSKNASGAIFWVLFVGGVSSGDRSEHEWFLAQLINYSNWLDVQSWEGAESILIDFLWTSSWDRLGLLLWTEIEEARLMNMIAWPETDVNGAEVGDSRHD